MVDISNKFPSAKVVSYPVFYCQGVGELQELAAKRHM